MLLTKYNYFHVVSMLGVLSLIILLFLSGQVNALQKYSGNWHVTTQRLTLAGKACHGANHVNGMALTDYANTISFLPTEVFDFWSSYHFPEIGVQGPNQAKDISIDTSPDSIMVTHFSAAIRERLVSLFGEEVVKRIPLNQLNTPIHDAYTIAPFDAIGTADSRVQLPWSPPFPIFGVKKLEVNWNREDPITLGEWNQARGKIALKCHQNGTGRVRLTANGLIPNNVYTAWQIFALTIQLPPGAAPIAGGPLGGIPNTVVANKRGKVVYERDLDYCPLELENPLMYESLAHHWDNAVYGASSAAILQGLPAGLVLSNQICFPVGNSLLKAQ